MKLLKAIIISISIFVFSNNANGQDLKETKGTFGEMPFPVFFANDYEVSVPTFLFRATQYQRFRLKKNEIIIRDNFFMCITIYSKGRH